MTVPYANVKRPGRLAPPTPEADGPFAPRRWSAQAGRLPGTVSSPTPYNYAFVIMSFLNYFFDNFVCEFDVLIIL